MARVISLEHEADYEGWRRAAKALRQAGVSPGEVIFRVGPAAADLLDAPQPLPCDGAPPIRVPPQFPDLARAVVCFRDPERFSLLYRLFARLGGEPHLLQVATDPDVAKARGYERAVRRDTHKMTAFVRFRKVMDEAGILYLSWFEPAHFIEERVAPFFIDRFASQRFAILTPRLTLLFNDGSLECAPPGTRAMVPEHDDLSRLWDVYYAKTFNPARVKLNAMRAEMPKRFWRNLPETRQITELVRMAGKRTEDALARAASTPPVRHQRAQARGTILAEAASMTPRETGTLLALRAEAKACQRCPLWEPATQTVFGEGPERPTIMFVGEQPGDKEDLAGAPFVGPAGQVFDRALETVGIDRSGVYVTNAVKHFKYEPRGKFRLHKKPNTGEIKACRFWLDQEREILRPPIIVAMGATAIQGLLGRAQSIASLRGHPMPLDEHTTLFATVHPSYLLRLPDPAARAQEQLRFEEDLAAVGAYAARTQGPRRSA